MKNTKDTSSEIPKPDPEPQNANSEPQTPDPDPNPQSVPSSFPNGLLPADSLAWATWLPGEDVWDWLDRNAPRFLLELARMALSSDPKTTPPKVKLDALRELISRPVPVKNVYEIQSAPSEVDRMSDAQVRAYLAQSLGLPAPEGSTEEEPEPTDDKDSG